MLFFVMGQPLTRLRLCSTPQACQAGSLIHFAVSLARDFQPSVPDNLAAGVAAFAPEWRQRLSDLQVLCHVCKQW
jgi:hypothetical protein